MTTITIDVALISFMEIGNVACASLTNIIMIVTAINWASETSHVGVLT